MNAAADQPALILAIETSSSQGSVALLRERSCLAEYAVQSQATHSRRLLAAIDQLFQASGLDWPAVTALAVGLGPGSFTGLRIGLATAKGLAMAAEKPLIGIPSLDGLACQCSHQTLPVCSLIDARRQEVYAAFYQMEGTAPRRTSDYLSLRPEDLSRQIDRPTLLVGSGALLYQEFLQAELGDLARFLPATLFFSRAAGIGHLALEKLARNDYLDPTATPLYLRPSL